MNPNKLKVSIVIPTYNSAQRIHILLENLIAQDIDDNCLEVIVIDNNSNDNTGKIAANFWRSNAAHRKISFRVIKEERQGSTYARMRGVIESRSPIICFLDDDNYPVSNDYVKLGIAEFLEESIGLVVSRVFADYQGNTTASINKREHLLAINEKLGSQKIDWQATPSFCPSITAGMWIRREVFLSAVPWDNSQALLSGRVGDSLTGGEDIEIGYFVGKAGFKRIYSPDLRLKHLIPANRLNTKYFCRLINGIVRGTLTLESKYKGKNFGVTTKLMAMIEIFFVCFSAPIFVFIPDGMREFIFIISARWAKFQGPYLIKQ
jgi:glycosyltransferase involved in cell wall biosynthesis